MQDLFATQEVFQIGEQSFLYRGALLGQEKDILTLIQEIEQQAPFATCIPQEGTECR